MTRNSPPKLGGEPARTKSEQAGWFPCRYWQLREPPRPRLRSGTPPNLGGECPHSNSFTAPMYAVIRSGGKQYRVSPGQTIRLEKFAGDVGSKVEIKDVLLVENDGSIQLGTPVIANVTVEGTVIEQDRMKKIIVFKKKRKKQY